MSAADLSFVDRTDHFVALGLSSPATNEGIVDKYASLGLSNRALDIDVFEHYPLITFLSDSFVYADLLAKLRSLNSILVNRCSSIAAIVSLVKAGYGIATLPIAAVHDEIASGDIVPLNLQPALAAQPMVANLRAATDSPLAEPLVQLAREAVVQFVERYPASGIYLES